MNDTDDSLGGIRSVAIIGSGMSGLTSAIRLKTLGITPVLFEKSRGPGGRLAAKRVSGGAIDMGAQYFTIRSPAFRAFIDEYAGPDTYAVWPGKLRYQLADKQWTAFKKDARYVGVPRMTAISRALSDDLDIRFETRVARIERDDNQKWLILDTAGGIHGGFDAVVITAPPAQTQALLRDSKLERPAQDASFVDNPLQACWSVAARFSAAQTFGCDGFSARHSVLQWAANNSTKPGRAIDGNTSDSNWWVLHAQGDWSEAHQDASPDWVKDQLISAFGEVTESSVSPLETLAHRWLYAKTVNDQPGPRHRWFPELRVGLCGDWLKGGRVEGAFESAESLMAELRTTGVLG